MFSLLFLPDSRQYLFISTRFHFTSYIDILWKHKYVIGFQWSRKDSQMPEYKYKKKIDKIENYLFNICEDISTQKMNKLKRAKKRETKKN